jgi:hypothetical protein
MGNQIDHILVDRQRHSNELDVRSFRAGDCDSDHYLVVAKVREKLAVNKHRTQRWETIRENINISAKESLGYSGLKKRKPWFDEGCSKLLDQRKEATLQWLQDPSEINGDSLNNVRREANRYFRNKKRE